MAKKSFINSINWEAFKKKVFGDQPLKKEIYLHEIEIISESKISYKGTPLNLAEAAQSDLRSILGLPVQLSKSIDKTFGEAARRSLIDMCKLIRISSKKVPRITLVIDTKTKQIIRILRETRMITMQSFFDVFEGIMNQHPNFETDHFGLSEDGSVNLSVVSKDSEFKVGNFADEVFQPGLTLKNSLTDGAFVNPYVLRLVCSNGMSSPDFGSPTTGGDGGGKRGPISLGGDDFTSLDFFYKQIEHLTKGNFYPESFKAKVQTAIDCKASLAEVQDASSIILSNSEIKKDQIHKWVPEQDINSKYAALKVNVKELTDQQKKNTRTNVTVWELINGVTDFASHDYGFKFGENGRMRMQLEAGKLLAKSSYDTQNHMNIHLG